MGNTRCCDQGITALAQALRDSSDHHGSCIEELRMHVSKNDEFWIQNEKWCIKNKELCIKNDDFCRITWESEPKGGLR